MSNEYRPDGKQYYFPSRPYGYSGCQKVILGILAVGAALVVGLLILPYEQRLNKAHVERGEVVAPE